MVDCAICKENLGYLDTKHRMEDDNGELIYYCGSCHSDWEQKQNKIEEIKRQNQMKKILAVNPKWEYMVKKIETAFGGRVKTEDDELHKLGQEGWELVSTTAVNQANMFTGQIVTLIMAFKRRIP